MALGFDFQLFTLAGGHRDVEVARVGGDAVDRALFAPELAAHDAHARAVVVDHFGNLTRLDVLIARRRHLQRRRQVGPELKAVHAALRIALRHLLMHDAAARGHPLHVAGAERAAIAEAVAVLDRAGEHIGDGLDAAMRMPRKTGEIVLRPVVAEIIKQQERIGLLRIAETESAAQLHAGAFDRRFGLHDAFDGANGHDDDTRAAPRALPNCGLLSG